MTLPVYMYTEVLGLFNFGKGTVVALILIIPALIAFFFDLLNKDVGTLSFVTKPFVLDVYKRQPQRRGRIPHRRRTAGGRRDSPP